MSDNPLEDSPERDERIKQRAYHLWQADDSPHGRDAEYWERARELIGMEESAGTAQLPNPTTLPGFDPTRSEPVEEAFIQDNLGEFPGRLTDQGDARPTPQATRGAARENLDADAAATGAAGPAPKPRKASPKK